mgnify:CR=1 FL=1
MSKSLDLHQLLSATQHDHGPYVTIVVPVSNNSTVLDHAKQTYKSCLKQASDQLQSDFSDIATTPILDRLAPYTTDNQFWLSHRNQTVYFIASASALYIGQVPDTQPLSVVVAQQPNILPLVNHHLMNDYLVLALNHDSFKLYRTDGQQVAPVALPDDAPQTLKGTLGTEKNQKMTNTTSRGHSTDFGNYHGHNEKSFEVQKDRTNYYYQIADYVLKTYAQPLQQPVILFGLPENQTLFKTIAKHDLIDSQISINTSPAKLSDDEINRTILALAPQFANQSTQHLHQELEKGRSKKLVLDSPEVILDPLWHNQIHQLIICEGAHISGSLTDSGKFTTAGIADRHNNLLNDFAIHTLRHHGSVIVLPANKLPAAQSVTALLRHTPVNS